MNFFSKIPIKVIIRKTLKTIDIKAIDSNYKQPLSKILNDKNERR